MVERKVFFSAGSNGVVWLTIESFRPPTSRMTTKSSIDECIPKDIRELYEFHNYRNAAQVLATGCAPEFQDLLEGLRGFRLTIADIRKPGGNESDIPKRLSELLWARGWRETRIKGDLVITKISVTKRRKTESDADEESEADTVERIEELRKKGYAVEQITRENFLDGHKVDYIKNRVAFDLEWNSKDQTFDRDPVAPGAVTEPGFVLYRFSAPLYYANANRFSEETRMLAASAPSPLHWLIVDAGAITHVDFTAARVVSELQKDLAAQGTGLVFAHVQSDLKPDLDRHHLTEVIGPERIFDSLHEALAALRGTVPR